MADTAKLRELMEAFGMMCDSFEFEDDFKGSTKLGFIREYLATLSPVDAADYTTAALELANDQSACGENMLSPPYVFLVQKNLVEKVADDIEQDMIEIIDKYQSQWHQM
jgi:hypothetical protein